MSRIPYTKPSITELEISFVDDAMRNGWGPRCYEYIERFEADFSAHLGVNHAIATSSCTGALQLGLAAIGIGPGDEVILADSNWIATVSPVVHLGARPVFVDILPHSWCLDPVQVERAITVRTKAIIATHLYGNLAEMEEILAIGARFRIPIIEDAAEAIGSVYHGRPAGSMGLFGVFSFHGSKTLTTGEGGMFVTNDASLYEEVLTLSNHGRSRDERRQFWPEKVGYKFKMSNIQAAMGFAQLQRFDELVSRKQQVLNRYKEELPPSTGATLNPHQPGCLSGSWMPNLVFPKDSGITRELAQEAFSIQDIDARVFFWPLSSLPLFARGGSHRNARDIAERSINLPSYHDLEEEQLLQIVEISRSLLDRG
jgi:perosamine synthetase